MPSIPITIMSPEAIDEFAANMDHPLRLSLQENDLWDWSPLATMYIFHGEGDELVPYANAELAYNQFIENGVENIYLETIPDNFGGHQDVAPWALFGAYQIAKDVMVINALGDVNQDREVNIQDLVLIVNIILGGSAMGGFDYTIWASDVNMDAYINIQDIILLINSILDA